MKIFSGIIGVAVLAVVLCFALSNPQQVMIGMWPFDSTIQMPLFFVGLTPLVFGLVVGALSAWLAALPHRLRTRRLNKELSVLNDRIGELQKSVIVQSASFETKKRFWER
jgi:uncharacterized integral membrane protein